VNGGAVGRAGRDRVLSFARDLEPFGDLSFTRPPKRARRRYAVTTSPIGDAGGTTVGRTVVLQDVTAERRREQRLAVLNRVLRHNLRNQLEVIKANAEVLADRSDGDHAPQILDSADELVDIGRQARSIDRSLSRPLHTQEVDLVAAIHRALEALDAAAADVDITVDVPERAPVVSDRDLVESVLESALDNAVRYAEGSVRLTLSERDDGYSLAIADDGPGIPEIEHAPVDAGVETAMQHGTGLGLWRLKWGVTKLNGNVAFNTGDGTRSASPSRTSNRRRSSTAPCQSNRRTQVGCSYS